MDLKEIYLNEPEIKKKLESKKKSNPGGEYKRQI